MNLNVRVTGCVKKMGDVRLRRDATVGAAIRAAGGFRRDNDFIPSGVVSVRSKRKRDGKYYCRRRLNYKHAPRQARSLRLREGDVIVVQYGFTEKWISCWTAGGHDGPLIRTGMYTTAYRSRNKAQGYNSRNRRKRQGER